MTTREIADDMADRIDKGEYAVGAVLPSRRVLAAMYSVSVSTADRVMMLLVDRGYAYGEPGRGTFVADPDQ